MYFSIFIFRFSKLNLVGIIIDRVRYQILLIIHKKWPNIHFCDIFWQWTIFIWTQIMDLISVWDGSDSALQKPVQA